MKHDASVYSYVFNYTDHLGNVRLSYSDIDKDGTINKTTEVLEESNYYPFGLKHEGYTDPSKQPNYKYKYNGKELQDELGLNMYDYGARNYDPALCRWMNMDPLAELNRRWTPYNYTLNSPVYFIDPDGMRQAPNGSSGNLDKEGLPKEPDFNRFFPRGGSKDDAKYSPNDPNHYSPNGFDPKFEPNYIGNDGGGKKKKKKEKREADTSKNTNSTTRTYSENVILSGNNGTSESFVNVEFRYTVNADGEIVVNENSIKVNTAINDILSPLDKYYENKVFSLTVNSKAVARGQYIVFEAKGTYVPISLKVGGVGFELNPVVHTFTGVINIAHPSQSFANYTSTGNGVGRLAQ